MGYRLAGKNPGNVSSPIYNTAWGGSLFALSHPGDTRNPQEILPQSRLPLQAAKEAFPHLAQSSTFQDLKLDS